MWAVSEETDIVCWSAHSTLCYSCGVISISLVRFPFCF